MPDIITITVSGRGDETVDLPGLQRLIAERGYSMAAMYRGSEDRQLIGASLNGPRGHKHFLNINPDGRFDTNRAKLWCDGVDYATRKLERNRIDVRRRQDRH